ncbi:MAG: hypothetical protein KIT35_21915 [Piscinibacter sp.]|uniref:hypothetical protein n=1 Tax=Piscinibacter sp. TaxID=1903157 RepID=UPI002582F8B6|nr:hypothetical protein [Piscinibacter sp.]MCW5666497.1 hypothetical protein [Piscinibacter sp.]
MPKHVHISDGRNRMHPDTTQVLRLVLNNPGRTIAELQALEPSLAVAPRLHRLAGVRVFQQDGRYYAREHLGLARAAKKGPPVAPPRTLRSGGAWEEPYLSDAGVRSSGLQFRECPSRRGNQLVYCYRRGFGKETL